MNKSALHKIIRTLVLNKYDWIEDYDIVLYYDAPYEEYNIIYYVKPDESGSFTVTREMDEVDSLTHILFKMVGADPYCILNNVGFRVK